jgi:hypothetical protein
LNIYGIIFFPPKKFILKDFAQTLSASRLLNSCEGDPIEFCNLVNREMGLNGDFALSPEDASSNPMKKTFFKLKLNTVFGKLSSRSYNESTEIVRTKDQLESLFEKFKIVDINTLDQDHLLVTYENDEVKSSAKYNMFIGSLISAYGRIYLYENMMKLFSQNIRIYAIDTDSVFFELPLECPNPLKIGITPGHFKHVINPDYEIVNYYSLGNRSYSVTYKDDKNELKSVIKCKGLSFKCASLCNKITPALYESFLHSYFQKELKTIMLDQVRYKTVQKRYLSKQEQKTHHTLSNEPHLKRIVKPDGSTVPFGFNKS